MRVFKSREFVRFARQEQIADHVLCETVRRADAGHVDADYGGGLIKQRIPRPNQGRSGGYRSIIVFRRGTRAFFVFGFAKNRRDNIDERQLRGLKLLAGRLLQASDAELATLLAAKSLEEVGCP